MYGIRDIVSTRRLTKLRIKFSELNEHRLRHNFDCVSPFCLCDMGEEDNEHFPLHCHRFDIVRTDLFGWLSNIPALDLVNMGPTTLCELLLYGSPRIAAIENRLTLEATFIGGSKRLG